MALIIQDVVTTYVDTYNPTSNENAIFNNIIPFFFWLNSMTGELRLSTSQDNTNLSWRVLITSLNVNSYISSYIANLGYNIDTARSSSNGVLSFNSSRTPNANSDTLVTVSISQTSTLLAAAIVSVQIDYGSGFVDHAYTTLSGIAATQVQACTFLVPKGKSYKILSVSGSNSISLCKETSL